MAFNTESEMDDAELDEFLAAHETGVLSLARDDEPYAIPISYGYDTSDRTIYVRLVSTPESEKRDFLSSSPRTRIVVYDDEDDLYRSVVVIGTLDAIEPQDLTAEDIEQYGKTKRPLFEIWAQDKRALDIELYRCEAETVSGRIVEIDRSR